MTQSLAVGDRFPAKSPENPVFPARPSLWLVAFHGIFRRAKPPSNDHENSKQDR
jgi:hypothetical protein